MTSHPENVQELITRARCVLFDFDGPVCRLFAGYAAHRVAGELVAWLDAHGKGHELTAEERQATDPWDVLRAVDRRYPHSQLIVDLEEQLTQEELRAASSADPTDCANQLVRTWARKGGRLAITTNNSPRAARKYLAREGLAGYFARHVYGRTHDLSLLKPHPDCLERALKGLDADPSDVLMVGDSPSDLMAAQAAGVAFLGYVRDDRKEALLVEAKAEFLVRSLSEVVQVLTG